MIPLSEQIAAYLRQRLPGAIVAAASYPKPAVSGAAILQVRAALAGVSYTVHVQTDDKGERTFHVIDADGDPVKNLLETWQDAADVVIAALTPAQAA